MSAVWTPCPDGCGDWYCHTHGAHTSNCTCPTIDEMPDDAQPYTEVQ